MHVYFAIQEACRRALPFREEIPEVGAKKKMFKRFFSTYVLSDYEQASKLIEET